MKATQGSQASQSTRAFQVAKASHTSPASPAAGTTPAAAASPAPRPDATSSALADGSGLLKISPAQVLARAGTDPGASAGTGAHHGAAASTPAYELEIPPFACAATTLAVTITGVENPAAQPFTVRAVLGLTYAPELILADIGRVTPRVADAAGTFVLALPPSVRELLAQRDGRLRLRLRLSPAAGSEPFAPGFKVRIAAPRWY